MSCSTAGLSTASSHCSQSSYTSYNLDADDADHMAYLESRSVIREDQLKNISCKRFQLPLFIFIAKFLCKV